MHQDYSANQTSGYGLAMTITKEPKSLLNLLPAGVFGHGGAFGTGCWVDPKNDLVMVFLQQMNDGGSNVAKNAFLQIAESITQ